MKLLIDIPKEFEQHFQADRFEDSLHRLSADAHLLAGLYEQETAKMLRDAFKNAIPVPPHGRLIDADALRQTMYHEAFETDSPMQKWDSGCWIRYKMFERMEEAAPTIIPAEEGEA